MKTARHSLTLAWRSLLKIKHSPDLLLDVVGLPITFVLMFVFLFGNSVSGDWRVYLEYVLPGIAVQAVMFASLGTAVGINVDVRTGVYDRLRSLPIARSAPLLGHVLGELTKDVASLALVFGLGAALGFRFHNGLMPVLAGFAVLMLFAFAVCWIGTALGLLASSAEAVQGMSVLVVLPFTFASNVFVPAANVPGWLRVWVDVNPVTQVATAVRDLMLGGSSGVTVRPALLWTAGIAAIFAPVAIWAYGRRH
jgi:oleandomycin transport system permease protein